MIKRTGALVLTFLYMITAMGFALNTHRCGSHIVSVKINAPAETCNLALSAKMKCCRNTHLEVKVKDVHQGQMFSFLSGKFVASLAKLHYSTFFLPGSLAYGDASHYSKPPDLRSFNHISYIKNRIFRI